MAATERMSVIGPRIDKLSLDVHEVVESGPVHSFISGIACHVPFNTATHLKGIVKREVSIHAFFPVEKLARVCNREITLERVAFDNFGGKPASGHLERLTLRGITFMVANTRGYPSYTEVNGTLHYLNPRFNGGEDGLNLLLEGAQMKLETRIPRDKITVGKPLFLEKIEMLMTNNAPVLLGIDPRQAEIIPEHPSFSKTCHDAIRHTALTNIPS